MNRRIPMRRFCLIARRAPNKVIHIPTRRPQRRVDRGHDRYMVAIPAQAGRPVRRGQGPAQTCQHGIGIADVTQVNRQILAAWRGGLLIQGLDIPRCNFFQVQRPVILHRNHMNEYRPCGLLQHTGDFIRNRQIARLKRLRRDRDEAACRAALAALTRVAEAFLEQDDPTSWASFAADAEELAPSNLEAMVSEAQSALRLWERQRVLHGDRRYVDWAARSTASWERSEGGTRQPA